ncbi:MAG TPA: hypothetical protein VHA77_12290 [Xanthobacteraceae bacterium]|jgi:hypothetical protein|nr:hypothetical protein [Xanthobacteraceae bacterium]
MMLAPVTGLALVVLASTGPIAPADPSPMSVEQKNTAMQPFVRGATECIARTVADNPQFREQQRAGKLGDLIVASMPTCVGSVRAMIDAYDRYFGDGSGEAFFMGPYLDVLPTAVTKWVDQFRR